MDKVPTRLIGREVLPSFFMEQPDVVAAYLFGSQATGRAGRGSDVDIAVLLSESVAPQRRGERRLRLIVDLERLCERSVDVVVLNRATPVLQNQVLRYGKLLFERDRLARVRFEVRARQAYFDLKPVYDRHTQELLERIKEVGLSGRKRRHS